METGIDGKSGNQARIRSLCVFCGSSFGIEKIQADTAAALGSLVALRGINLVYGGGNAGLMGVISRAVMEGGGRVTGVIPERLNGLVDHRDLTELLVMPGMHERKAEMYRRSDAFAVMPGGIGTLDELFEVWTWQQIGYHQKPVGILNSHGFFDGLLEFMEKVCDQGFMKRHHLESLVVSEEASGLLDALEAWVPTGETKKPERGT